MASAFPLAEIALNANTAGALAEDRSVTDGDGEGSPSTGLPPLPFLPPVDGSSEPSGASGQVGSLGGSSSRPGASLASQDRASASGSVLLSQVLGAAEALGYDVEIPELPTHLIAADHPLRAAILAWIASTGAVVPPDELVTQLARADALPVDVQRDVALLLLSTMEASNLQRAALAGIPPADLAWIQQNPQVAQDLVAGVDNPDTRRMAILSTLVDMPTSIAATLLVLQAVEATRGSLADPSYAEALSITASLDDATRSVLELLARAEESSSDAQKVRLAAKLVAVGSGIAVPEPRPAPRFADALQQLIDVSGMAPSAGQLADVLARANALPDDLEGAIARLIEAEALAIKAATPAGLTPTSQHEALAATLVATAEALPVLEKYHLYWRAAPEALRISEWDAAARAGWATHHMALLVTANDDLVGLVQAAEIVNGREAQAAPAVPARTFLEAYEALALAGGFPVDDATRAAVQSGADSLAPAVRDAATTLMSGAAESARLRKEALAGLTREEQDFLAYGVLGIDALYDAPTLTDAQLETLARATEIAERVDARKLAQSNAVAARAMTEAQRTLQSGGAFRAQSEAAEILPTGIAGLLARLNPFGAARAQDTSDCVDTGGLDIVLTNCVDQDVLLRIRYPPLPAFGYTPAESMAFDAMVQPDPFGYGFDAAYTCDTRECLVFVKGTYGVNGELIVNGGQVNRDLLVITGSGSRTYQPEFTIRNICAARSVPAGQPTGPTFPCRQESVPRYGAPTISIDLGGSDTYVEARAMVPINATIPVSFHLDVDGNDNYADPTSLYDSRSPLLLALGSLAGHPSQAAAVFGGAAILVDAAGSDSYEASTRSQGFGRVGVGLLADLAGTDPMSAGSSSQGASGETFTLGAGILLNSQGDDEYSVESGQGFGLGGLFLDIGGDDRYSNQHAPQGIPIANLQVLPGGEITAFDRRDDNLAWIDGPASINVGVGVDQEPLVAAGSGGETDRDGIPDVVEFVFGTDPYDPSDHPISNPTARATALLDDADGDGYPGYIERALSTDPADPKSYPAGLSAGIPIRIPSAVMDALEPSGMDQFVDGDGDGDVDSLDGATDGATGDDLQGSDKIVDLRIPVQDAGSVTYACTGVFYANQSAPAVGASAPVPFGTDGLVPQTPDGVDVGAPGLPQPGANMFSEIPGLDTLIANRDGETNAPVTDASGQPPQHCLWVSYQSNGDGTGNATVPRSAADGNDFTFEFPSGILAIGDVVRTNYVDDYLVVVDLGGNDRFNKSAGGALPLRTTPRPEDGELASEMNGVNHTFFAPSLVVNVDVGSKSLGAVSTGIGNDSYDARERSFVHGAFFGVLIDVDGPDSYMARDASQGALGGALLDLGGFDLYDAWNLTQGAGFANQLPEGNTRHADVVGAGNVDTVFLGAQKKDLPLRRSFPGLLLDAAGGGSYKARAHSQGFARGFFTDEMLGSTTTGNNNTPPAFGILASLGGRADAVAPGGTDKYVATGRYSQGVGGSYGVGILFDAGGVDTYHALGLVSQGSTISQTVASGTAKASKAPIPATGILVDLAQSANASIDTYQWYKSLKNGGFFGPPAIRAERNDHVTTSRSETYQVQNDEFHLFADTGLHVDAVLDPSDPMGFLSTIGGSNGNATNADPDAGFIVDLPTARLAIGGRADTIYTDQYAFIVDLGGTNAYQNTTAGGLLRDVIASAEQGAVSAGGTAPDVYRAILNAYPVTLLFDAGSGSSSYENRQDFTQGAGFFGVGIVVDAGGRDTFVAIPEPVTGKPSDWVPNAPVIDGTIGSDWDGVTGHPITLVAENDTRFNETWTMRFANDGRSLYLGLSGRTMSVDTTERRNDELTVVFDMARQHDAWSDENDRTGIDGVIFRFNDGTGACEADDITARETSGGDFDGYASDTIPNSEHAKKDDTPRFQAKCRTTDTGEVFFELQKDLIVRSPPDMDDLSYDYRADAGFCRTIVADPGCLPANELGIFVQFRDIGAGHYIGAGTAQAFSWPAGATMHDGDLGHIADENIYDETLRWAAIGLAEEEEDGDVPVVSRPSSLSHGAAIAGVGILAMLSNSAPASIEAGDRALGYGALQGLGFLIDLGGSDTYAARELTLGASEGSGSGIVVDLSGNERYETVARSLGFTAGTGTGGAVFMDLGGDDGYAWSPLETMTTVDQARGLLDNSEVAAPPYNNHMWAQNSGIGIDFNLVSLVSEVITGNIANRLYNASRTELSLTQVDHDTNGAPICTTRLVHPVKGTTVANVTAPVCLRAAVTIDPACEVNTPQEVPARGCLFGAEGFDNLRALAGQDSAAEALFAQGEAMLRSIASDGVNVSSVEFFLDRVRVAAAYEGSQLDANTSVWTAIINLSDQDDGVARIKALPIFTAGMPNGQVLVFQDGNSETNDLSDDLSHKTIYINNPATLQVHVSPEHITASAAASPYAYGTGRTLDTVFNVTPDADEERLALYNGWKAQPWNTALPCDGIPAPGSQPKLCNLLSFYLLPGTDTLSTTPGDEAVANPGSVQPESLDSTATVSRHTDPLRTELAIMRDESFHLSIPNRVKLLPTSDYTTQVWIKVVSFHNGSDVAVKDDKDRVWYLGYANKTAPAQQNVNTPDLGDVIGEPPVELPDLTDVTNALEEQSRTNVVWGVVNTTYDNGLTCRPSASTGQQQPWCNQLTGHYGYGQVRFGCKSPKTSTGAPLWNLFNTIATTVDGTKATDRLPEPLTGASACDGAYDHANQTANITGQEVQKYLGTALVTAAENLSAASQTVCETGLTVCDGGSDAEPAGAPQAPAPQGAADAEEEQTSELYFKDIYFDVNTTLPGAYWLKSAPFPIRFESDRVVLPPGYRLDLEFRILSGDGGFTLGGDTYNSLMGTAYGAAIDAANDATGTASTAPDPVGPAIGSTWPRLRDETLDSASATIRNNPSINNAFQGGYIPSAYFIMGVGDPRAQPRLDVRVPAHSNTSVNITLDDPATGDPRADVVRRMQAVGDRPHPDAPNQMSGDYNGPFMTQLGELHTDWTVDETERGHDRWTKYKVSYGDDSVGDGLYLLNVTARDSAGHVTTSREPVIVDKTPPATAILTSPFIGNAMITSNGISVSWAAEETGAGLREVFLFARKGDGEWTRYPQTNGIPDANGFPASQTSFLYTTNAEHNAYSFLTIGVDRANNVEAATGPDADFDNKLEAVLAGFANKVANNLFTDVQIDRNDPRFLAIGIDGGKRIEYQGSELRFFVAGQTGTFRICARDGDAESGVKGVRLELFPVDPQHQARAKVYDMVQAGGCEDGGSLFTSTTWSEKNVDRVEYPEGIWRVQMQVYDNGGNSIRVGGGAVVLDHDAPAVTVEAPVLPAGQTAVKPMDAVKIRLLATDKWGVDEGGIKVDASKFNQSATPLAVRPVRVNGIIYQEATFVVDKPGLQNGEYNVVVEVPDLAGNVTRKLVPIVVNFRPFEFVEGSVKVVNVTHNTVTLQWDTTEPTSALVKYGTREDALNLRTPQVVNATKRHTLTVEGLSPSTSYFLRPVSSSTSGDEKSGPLVEIETLTALFLRPVSPVDKAAVSGNVPVRFEGGLLDNAGFVTYTLEVRDSSSKPWSFVTTATRQGEEHTLFWNSTRFLDGKTYELLLTAKAGKDVATLFIGNLTSDNTPPSVLVVAPLIATNDTTPALNAEAGDELSGFGTAPIRLLVDGEPANVTLDVRPDGERLRIRHDGLTGLAPGLRTLELQVSDLAGNVAKETWKVAIDGDAPQITVNPTRFAPGTGAARNAGTVTLNLTIRDLSGVATVIADTTGLAASAETKLAKILGTDTWQGTFTVTDASPSATHAIPVRAVDLAGNANTTTTIPIVVDNVEPRILLTRAKDVTHTTAILEVPSENEPILVTATATAPASPPVTASTTVAAKTALLELKGLLPSRTYRFSLTATDLAGNPVTLTGSFPTLVDSIAPSAVGQLSYVDLLNGTLRLSWPAATDDVGLAAYRVYRSDDGGATFVLIAAIEGTTFEDRGLPYEKPYVYRVAALDHGGNEGPSSGTLTAAASAVPSLRAGAATPTVGTTGTLFRYMVTYVSPGGKAPAYVRVLIDGVPQNMTLESGDALNGALYVYETRLAPHKRDAPHTYAFETSDGRYTAKFPEDGSVLRGPLVSGSELSEEDVGRLAAFAQRVPLGGAATIAVAMIAALAIAAVLRRKKEGSK